MLKERELVSVTWWPLTQRWRVTRNRGSGRTPELQTSCPWASEKSRRLDESRKLVLFYGVSVALNVVGRLPGRGNRREAGGTCGRSHRENGAHGTLQSGVREGRDVTGERMSECGFGWIGTLGSARYLASGAAASRAGGSRPTSAPGGQLRLWSPRPVVGRGWGGL